MASIFKSVLQRQRRPPQQLQRCPTFADPNVPRVRDRGLDHAVEKEKNLKPLLAIKNLIKSEPSKSLPVSVIAENKDKFSLPTRAIEFIRGHPFVFQEFLPGGTGIRPHVRLTPEVLHLDDEEELIYGSENQRRDASDRLLKLLMLTRGDKLPLNIIDGLRWDLGLPHDYIHTIVPEFPDYFRITSIKGTDSLALELVCWSNELAVSAMEKKAKKGNLLYKKGMPISFPLQFSRGFDMEKKEKKWVDEWQKLPYISPYDNAFHLPPNGDQAEKWTVAVLHEVLHLLVSKKTEKDNILCLGEHLGLRSRFKRALLYHPGIFYLSNKTKSHTVVLREAYKRDLLLEKHPLMGMRNQYIHLMNKEQLKPTAVSDSKPKQQKINRAAKEGEGDDQSMEERNGESYGSSDSEVEDATDDDYDDDDDDDDDEEDDEDENGSGARQSVTVDSGRKTRKPKIEMVRPSRYSARESSVGRHPNKTMVKARTSFSRRTEMHRAPNASGRSPDRSNYMRSRRSSLPDRRAST
ncbi:hypothetical protein HHK36_009088 [Tetracentron sinense]|uniref:PORR domain-containing protein n=1 Tax=Tetracentron sinense TaxID=13715 RepID=A0A834ZEN4_TETSI|nr:hypothetical protein HHK36_009088 [Tetracentron sinense]